MRLPVGSFALVHSYKKPGAFGASGLLCIELGERATLSYCTGAALNLGEGYSEDASGPALDHHALQAQLSVASEKTLTRTDTLMLCPDAMSCSRRRKRYEMGERC